MYVYHQKTGAIFSDSGVLLGTGAAGQGAGLNNPDMEAVVNIGPLPRGFYKIGIPYHHPELGPLTMDLIPQPGNEMHGRDDFRIHGFAFVHPELSSQGCICQTEPVRQFIADHINVENMLAVLE